MAGANPKKPCMAKKKSAILGGRKTAKGEYDNAVNPNLKDIGKSIKPNVRSKPYK